MTTDTHSATIASPRRLAAEQPLSGPSRLMLIISAAAVTTLFYAGCLLALLFVITVLSLQVLAALALLRFGLCRVISGPIYAMSDLVTLIFKSLKSRRDVEHTLTLARADAPRLFDRVEQVARRMAVRPPNLLQVSMNADAWVQLRGYFKGRGDCTLGLGYDLFTVLSTPELESIIAHELAHARLVQRGLRSWLVGAIGKMRRLAEELTALDRNLKAEHQRFFTAELVLTSVIFLGRTASRLVGTYSRQDEFAADRAAAELCGTAPRRGALMTSYLISPKSESLFWRDRLVHSEREGSFSEWLRSQLTPRDREKREKLERLALSRGRAREFDTHPALADRLAALPECPSRSTDDSSALSLLARSDELGVRLLAELEQIAGEQERKHSLRRRKALRAERRELNLSGGQAVGGVLLVLFGMPGIMGFGGLLSDLAAGRPALKNTSDLMMVGVTGGGMLLGVLALWLFARRERGILPVPSTSRFHAAMESDAQTVPSSEGSASIEAHLAGQMPPYIRGRKTRARYWQDECYRALQACYFQRAYVAAQLCLRADPENLGGLLGHGISCAFFDQRTMAQQSLSQALSAYGLRPSVSAAMGWAHSMLENWDRGESYLLDAVERRPQEALLWLLLAGCQWEQGKAREAVRNARRAVLLQPDETPQRLMLLRLLLAMGRPREALKELEVLRQTVGTDLEVMVASVRAHLMLGSTDGAATAADAVQKAHPGVQATLRLARSYEESHYYEPARRYYELVRVTPGLLSSLAPPLAA